MIIDNNPVMMGQDEIIRLATELAEAVDNNWLVDGEKAAGSPHMVCLCQKEVLFQARTP